MVCLGSRRIEPLLGGPVIDPHRGAVACPAGGIGFAGSSKENPVLTIHHLEIVNHYTAIVDAGKADELALGLNRANRDFDGNSGLLQNCVRPQLNRLVHRHAFYLGQFRNRRIEQPAPLLGGDLFRG